MFARLLLIASVCCACSLQGLADGGGGDGAGGAPTTTTTTVGGASGDGGSSVTTGGAGGAPDVSRFVWLESIGNGESQATSPFSTDPHGSSLRMSEPDAAGAVWLAVVTSGELDPDGPGGFEAMGMAGTRGLFLIEVQSDGAISAFHGYPGPPTSIENGLSVDGVARVGIGVAVVGTFRTGSIDFGIGVITQNNANADDGYLLVADASGQAVAARQITGTSGDTQTARAVAALGSTVLAAGKLKRSWAVKDAATGVADPSCAFDDAAEVFERAYVASFDADTLSCDTLYTLTATDNGATQQVLGVAADASGVYLAGSFTRQIIAAPLMSLPVVSGEDGFVVALKPDLSPGAAWIARATSSLGGASDQLRSIAIDGTRLVVGGHLGTGTGSNTPSFGRATGGEVCTLEAPVTVTIDGFVGVLQKSNGDCLGATRLGEGGVDHVRAVIPDGQGVIATGFTDGMAGLETTVAAPLSRNGFIARLDASLGLVGGIALGGTSLDYVDGARPVQGGVVVAGSFGAPFDLLTTQDDFYVGKLELE